jgi:hypothetical protein
VQLVDGAHHITFLTDDMDRLIAFYAPWTVVTLD